MFLKVFIKVPLVLLENIFFSVFPGSRPFIERHVFNPYDFNEQHISYTQKKFSEFFEGTRQNMEIAGKEVLELGPGGSVGFGLLALKARAKRYYALDDGAHAFLTKKQLGSYRALVSDDDLLSSCLTREDQRLRFREEKISYLTFTQASSYPLPDASIDIIYSCAVLEHVHDLDLCFREMARVLKPGGIMYHEVDLRDHIFFQENPWFLAISDAWFSRLFQKTGAYVNRKRLSAYTTLIARYSLDILSLTTKEYKIPISKKVRKLYSAKDAATQSFIMITKKKA